MFKWSGFPLRRNENLSKTNGTFVSGEKLSYPGMRKKLTKGVGLVTHLSQTDRKLEWGATMVEQNTVNQNLNEARFDHRVFGWTVCEHGFRVPR